MTQILKSDGVTVAQVYRSENHCLVPLKMAGFMACELLINLLLSKGIYVVLTICVPLMAPEVVWLWECSRSAGERCDSASIGWSI